MATRTAPKAPATTEVIKGFTWKMAAVIEGPKSVLVPGAIVEVTSSKGKVVHVTVGAVVEEFVNYGLDFVKVWPASQVEITSANGNGNGEHA